MERTRGLDSVRYNDRGTVELFINEISIDMSAGLIAPSHLTECRRIKANGKNARNARKFKQNFDQIMRSVTIVKFYHER